MSVHPAPILTADSITRIGPEARGAVVVNGSHGGTYAAYVAAKLGVAAAVYQRVRPEPAKPGPEHKAMAKLAGEHDNLPTMVTFMRDEIG